jgi:hypothetical protein
MTYPFVYGKPLVTENEFLLYFNVSVHSKQLCLRHGVIQLTFVNAIGRIKTGNVRMT